MRELTRRGFIVAVGVGAATACSGDDSDRAADRTTSTTRPASTTMPSAPTLAGDPFTLGVASGDPLPDRVVLWTRLAPEPLAGGGMPAEDVQVVWEMAVDDSFDDIVRSGVATAAVEHGHAVHVDADGLEADHWYSYRFRVGDHVSPAGRTRTMPDDLQDPEVLRFGVASCQNWEAGYYNAWADVVATDLDLVLFLGDYIYENGPQPLGPSVVRQHNSPEITDLAAYRNRYALYRSDPRLRAAHEHCPWIVIWDDHEVDNDYAGEHSEKEADGVTTDQFLLRRAAAYQAWWEHMPVRLDPPDGPGLKMYRSFRYGTLASLFMLDTRQYRSDQACGVSGISLEPACPEVDDPARSLTGAEQESWLLDGLDDSSTVWNVIGNQVVMTPLTIGEAVLNYDQWDGYRAERTRILDHLATHDITNTVVVTGDIHVAGVGDLAATVDGTSKVVATELVGTSISSSARVPAGVSGLVTAVAPQIKYFNADRRGWCHCTVTPKRWTAEYRIVADNLMADSASSTDATFTITPDAPGAVRA